MNYIKIAIVLLLISNCLLLIGLFPREIQYIYIFLGVILSYIGIAALLLGAFKRYKIDKGSR
ncbi:hypothetical protein CWR48_06120 [Oceanobacillus arenosus]|uniref:Uncharacterized protein n=1 Tax=Oceanobacillus arenosus TaxID=1229153 RepID=A0A3D8PYB4_9BACI|nr:hypothetical protein CWR48_06120 [Oceanobacillus arenosus]